MYVCKDLAAPARAYTRTQARGATPELRRVADTTSHGLSAGRHSIYRRNSVFVLCSIHRLPNRLHTSTLKFAPLVHTSHSQTVYIQRGHEHARIRN